MPNWKKVILSGSNAHINNLTASGHLSALDDGFTVNENATTELYVDGNITATGDIIAENYIVSSSVTYMTQSFSSGSTVFGDSLDPLDTHQFTGSLFITGITYDDTPQPAAAVLIIDTASGQLYYTGSYGGEGGEDDDWHIDGTDITSSRNVIVNGDISASGDVYGYNFYTQNKKALSYNPTNNSVDLGSITSGLLAAAPFTASIISASEGLIAEVGENTDTSFKTLMYDTTSGKFWYTGSYGGSGGSPQDLQDVTDNGQVTTNGGVFWSGQSYRWGGWSNQTALAGFQTASSSPYDIAYTRTTPQRAGNVKWNLVGNIQSSDAPGRLDPRNWLVFEPNLYVVSDEIYNSGGNIGTPEDGTPGGIGGMIIENGGLQIKTDSASIAPSAISIVPGNEGPGIYFFERGSTTSDTSGSINHYSASARILFDTGSQAIQFQAGSTDEDLVQVMHISRSGDNPRIGIGTNEPKAIFDFKDVEDSTTGAEIVLRSARTTEGALTGDEGGSINFTIDSGSFGAASLKTSGSLAKIKTIVNNVTTQGAQGRLAFEIGKDTTSPNIDIMTMGYQEGGAQGFGTVLTSSLILKGFNAALPPELILKDNDNNTQFLVDDGNVTISGSLGVTGSATFDGGATSTTLTLTNPSVQSSEATSLMINGSGVVGTRELGTAAFREADQHLRTTDDVTFNTVTTTGNLTVEGDIIAQNYIVSSSVTYMTQSFSSGSTIFGDTLDDTHQFTGSIDVTGSLTLNQGGLKVFLDSGSAFEVDEPDIDLGGRFKFSYSQGDPTLSVISRSSTATLKLVANNESGGGLTLTEDGLIQKNGTKGVVVNEDDFYPNTNDNVALGRSNRQWTDIYATGIWYGNGANNLFSIGGTQRADGKYNGGLVYFGFADDGLGNAFDGSLRNPDLHYLGIGSNNGAQNSLHNEAPVYFKVGKSGSLSINLDQGDKGMGGDNFKFYTASAMVHVEAEPNWNMDLFRGDKTIDDTRFKVDKEGNTTISGSLTAADLNYPTTDGDNGDVLITDGAGNLSFTRTTVYANVKNVHGSELVKGMPVHVTGAAGNTSEIVAASASNAATMPAHFILNETLADDAEGLAIAVGYINGVNTGDFSEGDTVYVAADGGYTNVKPTGSNLIQNLGIVDKVDTSNGSGFILGAGRSNDVPNITSGYAWVGNSDQVATAVATSSFVVDNANTASYVAVGNINGTIDISDQTNLAGGTNLTLSGDTMNLDANISLTSITASGNISASGDIIGATGSFDVIFGGSF